MRKFLLVTFIGIVFTLITCGLAKEFLSFVFEGTILDSEPAETVMYME